MNRHLRAAVAGLGLWARTAIERRHSQRARRYNAGHHGAVTTRRGLVILDTNPPIPCDAPPVPTWPQDASPPPVPTWPQDASPREWRQRHCPHDEWIEDTRLCDPDPTRVCLTCSAHLPKEARW